jgi:nucleoside-diphosphate-sugar epimerase
MTSPRRVLVTGNRGYIGSVLAPYLAERGYDVVGLDTGYFDDCTLLADSFEVPTMRLDLRDVASGDLRGVDAIVHLAALSNDPIGNLNAEWTKEINHEATVRLAELAKDAGVRRFLFSSSCIMYGTANVVDVDETAPLDPKTEYARSKVRSEHALTALADDRFSPTFLRNGTVYGLSPRMRFDTVLNDLVGSAFTAGVVRVHGDGKPWRPVVHVQDVARAFRAVLEAPIEDVHNEAFNIGADHLNHQVLELAHFAVESVPDCELEVLANPGADQRTYRAHFGKWASTFPEFEFRWTAEAGARDLSSAFARVRLTSDQYLGDRYTRLRWLSRLLDKGALDGSLRWARAEVRCSTA